MIDISWIGIPLGLIVGIWLIAKYMKMYKYTDWPIMKPDYIRERDEIRDKWIKKSEENAKAEELRLKKFRKAQAAEKHPAEQNTISYELPKNPNINRSVEPIQKRVDSSVSPTSGLSYSYEQFLTNIYDPDNPVYKQTKALNEKKAERKAKHDATMEALRR
jgi:hypothetical protein